MEGFHGPVLEELLILSAYIPLAITQTDTCSRAAGKTESSCMSRKNADRVRSTSLSLNQHVPNTLLGTYDCVLHIVDVCPALTMSGGK